MPLSGEFEQLAQWAGQQLNQLETKHTAWKILTPIRWALSDLEDTHTLEQATRATRNIWNSLPEAVVAITVSPDITVGCTAERLETVPDDQRVRWSLLEIDEYAERMATALNTSWERTITGEE